MILPIEDPRNPSFHYKDTIMEEIENTSLFNSYLKEKSLRMNILELYGLKVLVIFHT